MKEEVFPAKWSLKPVTNAPASCIVDVDGKLVKLIDTPGFMDPQSLSNIDEFKGLAKAILDMPIGINAVGIVINIRNRISSEDAKLLEMFLLMEDMISYTFLIFTHAKVLGTTENDQKALIESILRSAAECPEILKRVLSSINNRYMLLESVEVMEKEYYDKKTHELLTILEDIKMQNKTQVTLNCILNDIACQLESINDKDKDELIDALAKDLLAVSTELKKQKKNETEQFWRNLIFFIAGGVGIGVGASAITAGIVFSPKLAAAKSSVYDFLSKNPQLLEPFSKAMADILTSYAKRIAI